jgi:Glycosyl transferase family 2
VGQRALPVSVVVPAYRAEKTVERAVESALAQRPAPLEVIVVDDASPDRSGELAAALGARVITHERNIGEGGARNTGLAAASESWVALLDADDEWLPGHLATLWSARDGHVLVGAAALGCGGRPADHRVRGWAGPATRMLRGPADVAVPENKLTASSVLLLREAALAAGGFPTEQPRAADLDLWLRMLERGTGVALPRVTALYYQHPAQVSAERGAMDDAVRHVLARYGERPWCTASVRRRVEGRIAWDAARSAQAGGTGRRAMARQLAWILASPSRAYGVGQTVVQRFAARRLTGRYAPGGEPSVAIMPGAAAPDAQGHLDLRDRSRARALAILARHPTATAAVSSRAMAVLVRALGVRPVSAARGRG